MKFIDYVYYKITRHYLKSEGQYSTVAIFSISLTLFMLFLELFFDAYNHFIPNPYKSQYRSLTGQEGVVLVLVFSYFVYLRFKKGYYFFRKRFENESPIQSFFGWIAVALFHVLPWLLFFRGNSQL